MPETITIRERTVKRGDLSLAQRALEAVRSYTVGKMSLKDPALAKLFGVGYQTAAGIPVTDENIYTFSAVYDAVNQSSSDLAKLPLNLRKRRDGGGSDPFEKSKTYWLLKNEANPDMSAFEFRRTLQAHALTCKGGFAEIERDAMRRPAALWPLTPDRVEPFLDKTALGDGRYRSRLRYRIDGNARTIIESADMIHIRGLGYDGYCAYPVIDKARQAIGLALAAERFAGAFFGNNSNLGGVLASDQDLDPAQATELQERIEKVHKGPDRAWRMLVLGAGFKYFRTGVTPSESQMNDLRSKQVEEVARFFNMPVHKLKNLDRATNNNIEQQALEYYTGHQLNWITNWEQELNRKLVPSLEQGIQFFKHNANATLRADAAGRTALYTALLDRGVFCADDVLEWEDMNPQPNGQGKMYLVQGAMVPKDKIGAIADAQIDKAKAKAKPPAPAAVPATDQQVEDANARAARAEELASEARAAAQIEREARIAAEASGTATAAELQERRASETAAITRATQFEVIATDLRGQHAAAEAARVAITAELADVSQARDTAMQAADEARGAAELAAGQVQEAEQRVSAAGERLSEAQTAAAAAEERALAARADVETAGVGRVEAEAARAVAEDAAAAARAEVERLEAVRSTLRLERDAASATAAAASAEAQRLIGEADARALAAEAARDEAIAQAASSRAAVEDATTNLDAAVAAADAATVAARQAADEARALAEERLSSATTAAEEATARVETAERALASETERAASREGELAQQIADLATARDAAQATAGDQRRRAEEFERSIVEAREQLATLTTVSADVRSANETSIAALQTAVAALERERDEARSLAAANESAVAESAGRISQREDEIRSLRQADADAMSGVIAAHRGLFVDIMRRMVERETDRARRAQTTPEKLARWLETFYEGHADLMRTALLPAVRVHLAFVRSSEDPIEATRRLVDSHVRESERQIRTVLEGDADAVAGSLPALLYRWDTERPTVIADGLMQKELDYARRL